MKPMGRTPLLRALSALGLVASLLLLARVPVCGERTCPMASSARAACQMMGLDCCKSAGERFSHTSAQPQLPDLFLGPVALLGLAEAGVSSQPAPQAAIPLAAPAVVQGLGLYTLFAVFLI